MPARAEPDRPATPELRLSAIALLVLAVVAVVTARSGGPARDAYASTDYGASGYRAWAELLTREGLPVARFVLRPIELDDRTATLIAAPAPATGAGDPRTPADIGALAAWVRAGGRLISLGRDPALRATEDQLLELPLLVHNLGPRGRLGGPLAAAVGSLRELGPDRMLLVEHAGSSELADGNGDIVVRYPLGRGEVVAVTNPALFANAFIGAPGNARLAYLIAVPGRRGGTLAFDDGLHGALVDRPWYRALPIALRVTLTILAIAAVCALVGSALPAGRPFRLTAAREPTSAEFIAALAALYERTGARSAAAALLARDALGAVARTLGLAEDSPAGELARRLGDRPGAEAVRRLAERTARPIVGDADFIASAKLAHTVRKESKHAGLGDGRRAAFAGRTRTRRRR